MWITSAAATAGNATASAIARDRIIRFISLPPRRVGQKSPCACIVSHPGTERINGGRPETFRSGLLAATVRNRRDATHPPLAELLSAHGAEDSDHLAGPWLGDLTQFPDTASV